MEIDGDVATLVKLFWGETGLRKSPETAKVKVADLGEKFERKDYPKVVCYNLNDLKEGTK